MRTAAGHWPVSPCAWPVPPRDPALIERALAVAGAIFDDEERSDGAARIRALTSSGMLYELSRWRLRSLGASIDLINMFLSNCHDKKLIERISLTVLDVVTGFPTEM